MGKVMFRTLWVGIADVLYGTAFLKDLWEGAHLQQEYSGIIYIIYPHVVSNCVSFHLWNTK